MQSDIGQGRALHAPRAQIIIRWLEEAKKCGKAEHCKTLMRSGTPKRAGHISCRSSPTNASFTKSFANIDIAPNGTSRCSFRLPTRKGNGSWRLEPAMALTQSCSQ